jgi:hypothetical protein
MRPTDIQITGRTHDQPVGATHRGESQLVPGLLPALRILDPFLHVSNRVGRRHRHISPDARLAASGQQTSRMTRRQGFQPHKTARQLNGLGVKGHAVTFTQAGGAAKTESAVAPPKHGIVALGSTRGQ